jgi:heme/copper-type cytochrome/quinol oxidase subunit 3
MSTPTAPEDKTPGSGAPDLGNEPSDSSETVIETIDQIPMGGLPEPGPSTDDGAGGSGLTDMPNPSTPTHVASHGPAGTIITEAGSRVADPEQDEHPALEPPSGLSNNKMGMWLFLGSECLLFGGLISTYMLYRGRSGGGLGPDQIYDIPFTSVSSFVLLMSSLTMVLAVSAAHRGDERNTRVWLVTTAVLGATFVGGQAYEFTSFYREGLGFTTSLFSSSFYTLTGFHGVHVTLGIVMLLALTMMLRGNRVPGHKAEVVELVGLYWHFVDIVWIIIFTLVYLIPA